MLMLAAVVALIAGIYFVVYIYLQGDEAPAAQPEM